MAAPPAGTVRVTTAADDSGTVVAGLPGLHKDFDLKRFLKFLKKELACRGRVEGSGVATRLRLEGAGDIGGAVADLIIAQKICAAGEVEVLHHGVDLVPVLVALGLPKGKGKGEMVVGASDISEGAKARSTTRLAS